MAHKVWCVFQRLPGENCPALSSVCASREVAEAVAEMSEKDEREQGIEPSAWTVRSWDVLDGDTRQMADVLQISDVLDPMRAGSVPLDADGEAEDGGTSRGTGG
ncbi:MAG: hypothetical protein JO040_01585 [Gemmatimonadetes bacterium]|nr:hypothetical protein [Gemmatimonadota bacterium]